MAIFGYYRRAAAIGAAESRLPDQEADGKGKLVYYPSSSSSKNKHQLEVRDTSRDVPTPRFLLSLRKHFIRYLICYLLAGIVFLAIFLPIAFLIILPAIAQRLVNNYNIPIYSVEITQPTLDSITLSLATALSLPLDLSVKIDPFDLALFDRDFKPERPYMVAPVSGYTLSKHTNITVPPQTVRILDVDQFAHVLTKAAYQKTVILSVKGKTTARLGALKVRISIDRDIEIAALDKLNGFSLDSAVVMLPPAEDGSNLKGVATIPNHTVVTLALGNLTLNVLAGNLRLGQATLTNAVITPGNNKIPIHGTVDMNGVLQNLGTIIEQQGTAISRGKVAVSASGNSSIYDGVHIPYLENILNNLTLTTEVPIMNILAGTLGNFLGANSDLLKNITERFNISTPLPL